MELTQINTSTDTVKLTTFVESMMNLTNDAFENVFNSLENIDNRDEYMIKFIESIKHDISNDKFKILYKYCNTYEQKIKLIQKYIKSKNLNLNLVKYWFDKDYISSNLSDDTKYINYKIYNWIENECNYRNNILYDKLFKFYMICKYYNYLLEFVNIICEFDCEIKLIDEQNDIFDKSKLIDLKTYLEETINNFKFENFEISDKTIKLFKYDNESISAYAYYYITTIFNKLREIDGNHTYNMLRCRLDSLINELQLYSLCSDEYFKIIISSYQYNLYHMCKHTKIIPFLNDEQKTQLETLETNIKNILEIKYINKLNKDIINELFDKKYLSIEEFNDINNINASDNIDEFMKCNKTMEFIQSLLL